MLEFLQKILFELGNLGNIGYFILFLFSFLESIILFGYFVPGTTIAIIFGVMAGNNVYNIYSVLFFGVLGNFLGSLVSYYLGLKAGKKVLKKGFYFLKPNILEKAAKFFNLHSGKSIFLGKTTPVIKEAVVFVAGIFKMDFLKFLFWNFLGAVFWSVLYVGIGYIFSFSLQVAQAWASRMSFIVFIIFVFLIFLYFLKLYFLKFSKIIFSNFYNLVLYFRKKILHKNKTLEKFFKHRFDKKHLDGLILTIFFIIIFYLISAYLGLIKATFNNSLMANLDLSISNLMFYFKHIFLIKFFLIISFFGNSYFILIASFFVGILFILLNKKNYLIGFFVSIFSSSLITILTKNLIGRQRPSLALSQEFSYSFPSFHASIAVSFYIFLAWIFLRKINKFQTKFNILFFSFLFVFLIGFSRIYLNVHYFSDILGGYIVGIISLFFGISVVKYLNSKNNQKNLEKNLEKKYIAFIVFVFIIFSGFYFYSYIKNLQILNPLEQNKILKINSIKNYLDNNSFLKYSSTITGRKTEPINFIFLASGNKKISEIFKKAGFDGAQKISPKSIEKLGTSLYDNIPYKQAPMLPLYWNKKIQDFSFQKSQDPKNIRFRHHIRIWKTNLKFKNNFVYVGCGIYDDGLKWHITHKIDPNIDKEREYIFEKLNKTGLLKNWEKYQIVKGFIGKNFSGDEFFTDGKAYILEIK